MNIAARRVLVVEDEPAIGRFLARFLGERGCAVDTIEDGISALRRLDESPYDLLLIDIHLPGASGWEVLNKRRLLASPPVAVVMSASPDAAAVQRARQLGASDFLRKPFSVSDLDQCITALTFAEPAAASLRQGAAAPLASSRIDLTAIQIARKAPTATAVTDGSDEIVAWNAAATALFGWSEGEALGQRLVELVGLWPQTASVAAGGQPLRRRDGAPVLASAVPVAVSGGICWFFSRALDETQESLLRRVGGELANAAHAVIFLDGQGRVRHHNAAAERLLSAVRDRVIVDGLGAAGPEEPWTTARAAVAGLAPGEIRDATARCAERRQSWEIAAGRSFDGKVRVLLVVSSPWFLRGGRGSDDRVTLATVVAGLAHEVRNPLFSISATVDAFEAQFGAGENQMPFIENLRVSVRRLAQLTSDLIDFGRPIDLEPDARSLKPILTQSVAACTPLAQAAGVGLALEVDASLAPVRTSGATLQQVLVNLLQNAVQHSPVGGEVHVTAANSFDAGAECVEVTVRDQGSGIDAAVGPRLFQPFFSRRRGGTGLGLAIVKRIVESHGGTIDAHNRPDGGAQFRLRLPAASAGPR